MGGQPRALRLWSGVQVGPPPLLAALEITAEWLKRQSLGNEHGRLVAQSFYHTEAASFCCEDTPL